MFSNEEAYTSMREQMELPSERIRGIALRRRRKRGKTITRRVET